MRTTTIYLPYDGTPIGQVTEGDSDAMRDAIESARGGAAAMASLTAAERSDLLFRVHGLVKEESAEYAMLLCQETGKPIKEARVEVERSLQTLLASAMEARNLRGEVVPMEAAPGGRGKMAMTVREPLGIIGAITPFNVPLNTALHKIGPALAGGNAVVHKPAEETPLTAVTLARTMEGAGVPEGAYTVVCGDGPTLGPQLVAHPDVAMITFTGSVPVGKAIRAVAGLKRVTLELGSNSGMIVEADADLDYAVSRAVVGSFSHSGQLCISVQRLFVQEGVFETFLEKFVAATGKLRGGHPYEETTDYSSLITEEAAIRVQAWIDEALARGAKRLTGSARVGASIAPTILVDVPADAKIGCQEVFGPVVAVTRYRDLDDAIRLVNATPYGLQAGVFTRDLERAFGAARKLHVGGVMINEIPTFRADQMPYGGVKDSGVGREGPRYAIEEMTEMKLICWKV
jgi:acyl-CoA reductase-like NAD-dependent aldehyde dehydrogenase